MLPRPAAMSPNLYRNVCADAPKRPYDSSAKDTNSYCPASPNLLKARTLFSLARCEGSVLQGELCTWVLSSALWEVVASRNWNSLLQERKQIIRTAGCLNQEEHVQSPKSATMTKLQKQSPNTSKAPIPNQCGIKLKIMHQPPQWWLELAYSDTSLRPAMPTDASRPS